MTYLGSHELMVRMVSDRAMLAISSLGRLVSAGSHRPRTTYMHSMFDMQLIICIVINMQINVPIIESNSHLGHLTYKLAYYLN